MLLYLLENWGSMWAAEEKSVLTAIKNLTPERKINQRRERNWLIWERLPCGLRTPKPRRLGQAKRSYPARVQLQLTEDPVKFVSFLTKVIANEEADSRIRAKSKFSPPRGHS